jgi:hypothetical protein
MTPSVLKITSMLAVRKHGTYGCWREPGCGAKDNKIVRRRRTAAMSTIVNAFQRVWPIAAISVAFIVTVAWIGLLGYGLARLGILPF